MRSPDQSAEPSANNATPFGLDFAVDLVANSEVESADIRYDPIAQLSRVRHGERWIPLITMDSPMTVQSTGELG
ncbi:MAG: hypothetical protein ACRDPW_03745, partial [Mycobacteriales bacterium]